MQKVSKYVAPKKRWGKNKITSQKTTKHFGTHAPAWKSILFVYIYIKTRKSTLLISNKSNICVYRNKRERFTRPFGVHLFDVAIVTKISQTHARKFVYRFRL